MMSEEGPKTESEKSPSSHYELFCVKGASWYLIDRKFGVNYSGYDKKRGLYSIAFVANSAVEILRKNTHLTNPREQTIPKISYLVLGVQELDSIVVDKDYRVTFMKQGTANQSAHLSLDSQTPSRIELYSNRGEITEILQAQMNSQV